MMAVRLRYSFRVNSRKVVSSRMGTLCSEGGGCAGLPDLASWDGQRRGAAAPCCCAARSGGMLDVAEWLDSKAMWAAAHDEDTTCEAQPS